MACPGANRWAVAGRGVVGGVEAKNLAPNTK